MRYDQHFKENVKGRIMKRIILASIVLVASQNVMA